MTRIRKRGGRVPHARRRKSRAGHSGREKLGAARSKSDSYNRGWEGAFVMAGREYIQNRKQFQEE
jgi:hypothetical protein